ncbi:MAG: hypothetical protein WCT39_05425, partial [Candidatus Margulisiibacteriota bacterium]
MHFSALNNVIGRFVRLENFFAQSVYFLTAAAVVVGTLVCVLTGNSGYLFLYYTILGHLVLAAIVYEHNRRNRINICYAFLVLFTGSMVLTSSIFFKIPNTATLITW